MGYHLAGRPPDPWRAILCLSAVVDQMARAKNNYSVVFRWWDFLHGTLRLNVPQEKIRIGVAGYTRAEDNSLVSVLALSFRRQRDYWRMPEGGDSRIRREWDADQHGRMAE